MLLQLAQIIYVFISSRLSIRWSFPCGLDCACCCRFLSDSHSNCDDCDTEASTSEEESEVEWNPSIVRARGVMRSCDKRSHQTET